MQIKTKLLFLLVLVVLFSISTSENSTLIDYESELPIDNSVPSDIEFGSLSEGEYDMYSFWVYYSDATELNLDLSGPTYADFDLYLKRGSQPSLYSYDYSSVSTTSDESITVNHPATGIWYVMVYAYYGSGSYSIILNVEYPETTPAPTSTAPPPPTTSSRTTTTRTSTLVSSTSSSSSSSSSSQSTSSADNSSSQSLLASSSSMLLLLGLVAGVGGVIYMARERFPRRYTPGATSISLPPSSYNDRGQTYGLQGAMSRSEELLMQGISYYNSGNYMNAAVLMIEVLKIDPNNNRAKEILLLSLAKLQGR